jgi:DNA replication and repair protein RecF
MVLQRLRLHEFRNYADLTVEFPPGVVLLVGANGQGKTNLLEAVEVAATTRSGRGARSEEWIRWGQQQTGFSARFQRCDRGPVELAGQVFRHGGTSFSIDGVPASSAGDVIRQAAVVSFGPGDLQIVSGSPTVRRRMLNVEISKLLPRYYDDLLRYRRALRQRNHLLRQVAEGQESAGTLDAYSWELARYAVALTGARAEYLQAIATRAAAAYEALAGPGEALELTYRPTFLVGPGDDVGRGREEFCAALASRRAREVREGMTLLGPHRDDFEVRIQGKSGRRFGSQGQQRTATIALRLAQHQLAAERLGESPVLLLDDVLSELDRSRVAAVLTLARSAEQVLLTATDADIVPGGDVAPARLFVVRDGRVERSC